MQTYYLAPSSNTNDARSPAESNERTAASAFPPIDLVSFLRVLKIRKEIIVGTATIFIALTLVMLLRITPLYSSSSIVMLNQQKNNVADVTSVLSGLPTDQTGMQNQVEILTSRDLAQRVIDKLNLKEDPDFADTGNSFARRLFSALPWIAGTKVQDDTQKVDRRRNSMIERFEKRLSVEPIGLSTAIRVTYQSPDASESARIDNAIGDAYVEDQLNAKFEATQKATRWLADRIQELSQQAQTADAAVQKYREENGLAETVAGGSVADQQTTDISAQLVVAKSDLAEKQAIYAHVSALARAGHAADISQAVNSPLIANLRGQEADLSRQEADLSSRYGPRNPKLLDVQSQKLNLDAKINEEVSRIVQGVANDVAIAQAHVSSLQSSLSQAMGQSGIQNELKVKLTQLQSAASSAKSMYEAFLARLNQTQDQEGIETSDARIISAAEIPLAPSYPNKPLVIIATVPIGLLLGLMLAYMMEWLDAGFRTPFQAEAMLGLPVLATIPELQRSTHAKRDPAGQVIEKPTSAFSESIHGLKLSLMLTGTGQAAKVILVTSSVPNEGKTVTALALARLASKSGLKTVLLDGDMRRPKVAAAASLRVLEFGLEAALRGDKALPSCLAKDPSSEVKILSCVEKVMNPSEILASEKMAEIITRLRGAFDLVIVDSSPVLPVHDTKILCRVADAVLFVVRWVKTPRESVANALRTLADVKAPMAGIVLTRAHMRRYHNYSYGYQNYNDYNAYYSE